MAATQMKISVVTVAYNHERYIAQAIESILAQKIAFPFEVIIADDCSTDNTPSIITKYAKRYPDVIRPILQKHNVGMHRNFAQALAKCTGKYVALLDGDDYWTCDRKLQTQIEFLDSHPDFAICGHRVNVVFDIASKRESVISPTKGLKEATIYDLFTKYLVRTASAVVRADLAKPYPSWFKTMACDTTYFLLVAAQGKIHVMDEPMAVYRVHSGGVSSGASFTRRLEANLGYMAHIDKHFNHRYHDTLRPLFRESHQTLACEYEQLGDLQRFVKHRIAVTFHSGQRSAISKKWLSIDRCLSMGLNLPIISNCAFALVELYRVLRGQTRISSNNRGSKMKVERRDERFPS